MAPEGATITLHLIVPQKVGSLEEVYAIIHDQILTLLSNVLQIIEQRVIEPLLAQGWRVVRSKKRTCRIWSHSTTIPIPFVYRVLKKGKEAMTPLLEALGIEKRRIYTQQARKEACIQTVECPTFRKAAQICHISRMSVWRWVQEQPIPTQKVKAYQGNALSLACESDRFYLSIRGEPTKQPVHLGLTYTGKEEIGRNGPRPYRRLVDKRVILEPKETFVQRFEGEIHDQMNPETIAYYSSDQGEPAKLRAPTISFTETFIDYFHLLRIRTQGEPVSQKEWVKCRAYRGFFGAGESNVKGPKKRLSGRTWSREGGIRFIRWMSYVLGGLRPLKIYIAPKKEQRPKDLQTTTDRYTCFLAQHQKNWIYRRGADGLIPKRSIDSGWTS